MEKDIQVSKELKFDIAFSAGNATLSAVYMGDNGGLTVAATLSVDQFLAHLEAGQTNSVVKEGIELLRVGLKAL